MRLYGLLCISFTLLTLIYIKPTAYIGLHGLQIALQMLEISTFLTLPASLSGTAARPGSTRSRSAASRAGPHRSRDRLSGADRTPAR